MLFFFHLFREELHFTSLYVISMCIVKWEKCTWLSTDLCRLCSRYVLLIIFHYASLWLSRIFSCLCLFNCFLSSQKLCFLLSVCSHYVTKELFLLIIRYNVVLLLASFNLSSFVTQAIQGICKTQNKSDISTASKLYLICFLHIPRFTLNLDFIYLNNQHI